METWLVTGGLGFIGSHFVRLVLAERPDVRVINLDKITYAGVPENLADVEDDPRELNDLYGDEAHAKAQAHLTIHLVNDLYGGDEEWVKDGQLIGLPDQEWSPRPNRNLSGVRGSHYPTPPQLDADKPVGMP